MELPLTPSRHGKTGRGIRDALPPWVREVRVLLPVTRQFILTGNIEDFHVVTSAGQTQLQPAAALVIDCCKANGFDLIYSYDPVDGIALEFERSEGTAEKFFSPTHLERSTSATLGKMADLMRKAMLGNEQRVAILMRFAARTWRDEQHAGPDLRVLLTLAEKLAHAEPEVQPPLCRPESVAGTVFWLAGQDVPAPRWLTEGDQVQTVSVPKPELGLRRAAALALLPNLRGFGELPPEQVAAAANTFARLTDGMRLRDLNHIVRLAVDADVPAANIEESIRSLRFGVSESPWRDPDLLRRIADGEALVSSRVLGQPAAVRRSLDVLVRAATGLTGAHTGGATVNRPQGILFFAGPTGVGKTELAKALAELLFGVEDAYTRFDMSEFSAEHSEARLIGAPPGYVGFGAGGELTNAVRQKPFSILLFDEIEKAHPRILDKFLQILEDGRLTDGAGDTVYFSETVIIFTSNLGTYRAAGAEPATHARVARRGDPYEVTQDRVHEAITHHFTEELQRPEILNRIGNNIVVFDFISEPVARTLAAKYVEAVMNTMDARFGHRLSVAPAVAQTVTEAAVANLDFGGRGVSSAVETTLVNPLARALVQVPPGETVSQVADLRRGAHGWEITLS
ncbi:AAA family ATPase [Pseudarthrobacter sp. NamE5]|uniref:AAA family ATPase n=1 Tax=Pseudarthrobacter sp. NamE5 TaxID=2576839 RepID=UPI00110AFEAD|nr:AAA family ATPase [Pseudarthrobacter sp. NamE5]TLM88264.1 ATP-dependent Clp protease ATP-binding subunit [Pseudarthrobacter sp. NamE5]